MTEKRDPKKVDQKEKSISIDDLKEMKSSALSIPRKLDDTRFDNIPNVIEESHALVDRFYQANKHRMTPEQCAVAKHDFEYFKRLLDLAIHYSAKGDHRRKL